MNSKIRPEHLSRPAKVYVRQSTMQQVFEHHGSTERQYDLVELAKRLGWDGTQVEVIDDDLGQSGASATNRAGFQRLAAETSLGRVGAILSIEVSRLARSSADWYRLLDLCALSDTLIVDHDGIYNPNDFNDRMVLGMKGTMSDAERHLLRLRLDGGKLYKARKGELRFRPPAGYVWDDGKLVFDPDEAVQKAIGLFFERFRLDGSAYGAVRYFRRHGLQFPSRNNHDAIVWHPLTHSQALIVLKSPTYAGAYVYGRRQSRLILVDGAARRSREVNLPQEKWHALVRDAHVAYITWDDYVENLKRLDDNRTTTLSAPQHGAPRSGSGLLQGIVLCGRCGRRMSPMYPRHQHPIYVCRKAGDTTCWSAPTPPIDQAVTTVLLEAMAPAEIDLSLAAAQEVERQADQVNRQWKLRIERARYEASRTERQYNAVEPENRLVARTLEMRWNEKLRELAVVEREHEEAQRARKLKITIEDKKAIVALAHDLPKVWHASTTTATERKQLLRLLVDNVSLEPIDLPERSTNIKILWKTGTITEMMVPRPSAEENFKTSDKVVAAIRQLAAANKLDSEIAEELNRRGLRSGRGNAFSQFRVSSIRYAYEIPAGRLVGGSLPVPERDSQGRYSIRGMMARYGVTKDVLHYWIKRGIVEHEPQLYRSGVIWFRLTPDMEARIEAALRRNGRRHSPRRRLGAVRSATRNG